ncbi:D-inositol-3-phosphate glycosyltransferase [Streptomyces tanashiensis]
MSLRVAMLSVHTSPLHQPGTGDAGGMNVYMVELSRALAEQGAEVDLFTRCRGEGAPPLVELAPGVRVRHLHAGPRRALPKEAMPDLVVPFALALLKEGRRYDLVHSHYWLSGQAGRIASVGWRIPLVHTAHTLARVKNASLAEGDTPEPELRVRGEHQVVGSADRLIANTADEAEALRSLYGAEGARTEVVRPGVDLRTFRPGEGSGGGRAAARARLGLPAEAFVPLYAGLHPAADGPDVLVRGGGRPLLRQAPAAAPPAPGAGGGRAATVSVSDRQLPSCTAVTVACTCPVGTMRPRARSSRRHRSYSSAASPSSLRTSSKSETPRRRSSWYTASRTSVVPSPMPSPAVTMAK